ncbi:MAG TPA: alpha-amylase family protein [Gaiellaceae bacterium]|nr:alpha-amylase family protein [Gaiellaceae bacterium]
MRGGRTAARVRLMLAATAAAASVIVLSGCSAPAMPQSAAPDAGVQLFQWPWSSIARECEDTIAPAGFGWVLTSPPQEHVVGDQWWVSYQPVSSAIESRLGTRDEFADMVARCGAVGVDVIADAVINHMTGQDAAGTGSAGTPFEHYSYPGLYETGDFHHCGLTPGDEIDDYSSREQVQTCELVNLADLDTSTASVRERIGAYLDDLLSLGVSGFRIDAAKHMAADDVAAIAADLPEGTRILSEVIRGGADEPVQPEEYTGFGEVFEFTYARDLGPQLRAGSITDPKLAAERPLHVPSDRAIVFLDNHDTERGEADVTYRDGGLYLIANMLMLADDYGTPVVLSGYAFTDRDAGAPADAGGATLDASCTGASAAGPLDEYADGERTCVHAWPALAGMLAWRAAVGDAPRLPGVHEGKGYGFEREGRGVVVVNPGAKPVAIGVPTTLPAGEYCDVVSGGRDAATHDGCRGTAVTVADGAARFELEGNAAAAIHVGSRAGE